MVRLEGTYTFEAPREVVWEVLMDPHAIAQALPGTQTLEEIEENTYRGVMNVRVGPVQGRFEGTVKLSDIQPLEGYRLHVEGKGPQGFVTGEGELRLEDQDGRTVLHYSGEAQVGGRIAAVGQRLIESTARSIVRQGLEALNRQVQARVAAQSTSAAGTPSAEPSPPPVETPSTAQVAAEVAKDVTRDLLSDMLASPRARWMLGIVVVLLILVIVILARR